MVDYLKALQRRGGKSVNETTRATEAHILPTLGPVIVAKLTARKIGDWQSCRKTSPLPHQAWPQTQVPQGRQQQGRHTQAARDSEPHTHGA
jgi:hypothetical protein